MRRCESHEAAGRSRSLPARIDHRDVGAHGGRRTLAVAVGMLAASVLVVIAPPADAAPRTAPGHGPVSHATGADTRAEQDAVRAFWTPKRMREAVPVGPERSLAEPAAGSGPEPGLSATSLSTAWTAGRDTVGKVFFQLGSWIYVCSGNAVDDIEDAVATPNLVVTAGHCVNDGGSVFATNFLFIPRYDATKPATSGQPLGTFVATRLTTTDQWAAQGSQRFNFDVGMALVGTNENGMTLAAAIGNTSDIGFVGGDPGSTGSVDYTETTHSFGYPAAVPYDGTKLFACWGSTTSDTGGGSTDYRLPCGMTQGSSGGPWLLDATVVDPADPIDNSDVSDVQISVNSFGYRGEANAMYGPIFGATIQALYAETAFPGGPPDTAAPVLSEFDFTPKSVDVTTGSKTVTVTARVTDATGVGAPTMVLDSDETTQTAGSGTMTLVSGTIQNRVWQRTVTIPTTAAPGSWTVTIHPLADTLGNHETGSHHHPSKLMVTAPAAAAPDAPTAVRATRGNGSAAVSWSAPADNGSPITSYTVTSSPGGRTVTVPGAQTTGTVAGLTNGTAYTFTVTATNAVGSSAASAPSASVVPASRPGRVAKPTVSVGSRQATIKWTAPRSGGSPLTGYRVTVNGRARTTAASAHKLVLRNLRPGGYTVKVAGINAVGVGPASVIVRFRIQGS